MNPYIQISDKIDVFWASYKQITFEQPKKEFQPCSLCFANGCKAQRIIPLFHVSLLRPNHKSDDTIFPKHKVRAFYDFGDAKDNEWLVDDIITYRWEGNNISFLVQWNLGDTTWELYTKCK